MTEKLTLCKREMKNNTNQCYNKIKFRIHDGGVAFQREIIRTIKLLTCVQQLIKKLPELSSSFLYGFLFVRYKTIAVTSNSSGKF